MLPGVIALFAASNAVADEFIRQLYTTVLPIVLLFGIAGLLLAVATKSAEKRLIQAIRARRAARENAAKKTVTSLGATEDPPHCPSCNAAMVKRKARRGANAGSEFWGCSRYPGCRGTRDL